MRKIILTEDDVTILLVALSGSAALPGKVRLAEKLHNAPKLGKYPVPRTFPGFRAPITFTAEQWAQAPACE